MHNAYQRKDKEAARKGKFRPNKVLLGLLKAPQGAIGGLRCWVGPPVEAVKGTGERILCLVGYRSPHRNQCPLEGKLRRRLRKVAPRKHTHAHKFVVREPQFAEHRDQRHHRRLETLFLAPVAEHTGRTAHQRVVVVRHDEVHVPVLGQPGAGLLGLAVRNHVGNLALGKHGFQVVEEPAAHGVTLAEQPHAEEPRPMQLFQDNGGALRGSHGQGILQPCQEKLLLVEDLAAL